MRLRPQEFLVAKPDEPFLGDRLGREQSSLILTDLLVHTEGSFVLSIDAGWGQGKSTFIRMWSQHLTNEGFRTLLFNAWENDFSEDPLISFMGELRGLMDAAGDSKNQEGAIRSWDKAKAVGSRILGGLIPAAAKFATAGFLDLESLSEEILSEAVSKVVESEIDHYKASKNALSEFRDAITEYVAQLDGEVKKPLVVIVDELDRCRPTYAVALLERVKHLFSVPNIVFVLAINKAQLKHSVSALYGANLDADSYLRRFIDLEYSLPEPSAQQFSDYLMARYGLEDEFLKRKKFTYDRDQFVETFGALAQGYGLSLRDQEQCFARLTLVVASTPVDQPLFPVFLAFLIILRTAKPDLYRRFVDRKASDHEVIELERWGKFRDSTYSFALEGFIEVWLFKGGWEGAYKEYNRQLNEGGLDGDAREGVGIKLQVAEDVSRFRQQLALYLSNKIEIGHRFTAG